MPVRSVLVIDDNPLVRRMLCEPFTREGDFDVCGEGENDFECLASTGVGQTYKA
jgi:chemotaxis response regulator CheB